ncbi:hypothetical protein GWK47_054426 [Chionoecetes opilio]|uniref:Uncharacterized protein n=1 Tax=Chionoecetes opilio TaxID=41210 RepID=A0A8J4Y635_CHIOP|nr:hypothetical protein GWK47_054426 [Chionoecetes opilio]
MRPKSAPSWSTPPDLVILPPSYLGLLDKVQNRAQRLISLKAAPDMQLAPLQPLQHRRDVAGLCPHVQNPQAGRPTPRYTPARLGGHLTPTPPGRHKRETNNHCSLRQGSDLLPLLPAAIQQGCGTV